jgi:hypothetical protein
MVLYRITVINSPMILPAENHFNQPRLSLANVAPIVRSLGEDNHVPITLYQVEKIAEGFRGLRRFLPVYGDSPQKGEKGPHPGYPEKLGLGYIVELRPQSEAHNGNIRPTLVFGEDNCGTTVREVFDALNPKAVACSKDQGGEGLGKHIYQGIPSLANQNASPSPTATPDVEHFYHIARIKARAVARNDSVSSRIHKAEGDGGILSWRDFVIDKRDLFRYKGGESGELAPGWVFAENNTEERGWDYIFRFRGEK